MPKVLRIERGGFRVLGGLRFSWLDNDDDLRRGFVLDLFGLRVMVSRMKPSRELRVIKSWSKPPRSLWIMTGYLDVNISPAYSGFLEPEGEA